jgi:hypothetical protein
MEHVDDLHPIHGYSVENQVNRLPVGGELHVTRIAAREERRAEHLHG